ncbi:MAG TPA: DUF6702 family protein [Bacteroidales bacterium]|nr:DUF6702 family protein [Bacteroidales bacterium]
MIKALLINAFLLLYSLHPLHVTLTTINQDKGDDTLKVFFRMYYDDFLKDYRLYNPDFNPVNQNDTIIIADNKIEQYFNNRVQIFVNRKHREGKLVKITNEGYEIHLDLIYHSDSKPRHFRISSHILTGVYSDQSNMIYIKINRYEDAMKLTVDHTEEDRSLK